MSECGVNIAMAFFNIKFSSSNWAFLFCSALICRAVKTVSSSIWTSEYCLIQFASALWETPYSWCICEYDLPEWYKFTIVCLNSLLYLLFFFPVIFIPPLFVFYFIILVHFFSIYPIQRDTTAMLTAMKKQNQDIMSLNIRRKTSFQKEKQ